MCCTGEIHYDRSGKNERDNYSGKIENQVSYEKINTEIAFSTTLVVEAKMGAVNICEMLMGVVPYGNASLHWKPSTVVPQEEYARVTGRRDFPCAR